MQEPLERIRGQFLGHFMPARLGQGAAFGHFMPARLDQAAAFGTFRAGTGSIF